MRGVSTGRYRSIFHTDLPAEEAFPAAEQQVRGWLGQKDLDREAFDRGSPRVGSAGELLLVLARNSPDGTQTKRWQLREPKPDGSWVSTLTVHAPGRTRDQLRSWFWLDVEFHAAASRAGAHEPPKRRRAGVPRLARALLDAVDARDSLARLREKPVLVRPPDIDELIDILCDGDRRMPSIVASAHPHRDFGAWRAAIERVTRDTAGLAGLYLLDPHATEQFNAEIGETHGVWGGAVRTYLPEVDPAIEQDARRHRVLIPSRIEGEETRAKALLAGLPRRLSAEALLPRPLTGLTRALLAGESSTVHPGGTVSTGAQEATEALIRENARLKENLAAALELVDEAEQKEELLSQRNDELTALSGEFEAVNQRLEHLKHEVRVLRRRLVQAGHAASTYVAPNEQTVLPSSFTQVLDRIAGLSRIEFTGDKDLPLDLDQMPAASSWAQTAWQAVLALNDYAAAKADGRFCGGFVSWCKQPPMGAQ